MNFIEPKYGTGESIADSVRADAALEAAIRASRTLIVDDQKMVRELLKIYLTNGGYENLLFAADGDEALDIIAAANPDLVVLDLQMPRMSGLEVCKKLRADPKHELLPVLVQAAADSAEDRKEIFRSGATDMVGKPINDAELLARVGIHLQNRHMLNELSKYRESMERDLQTARHMQHQLMPSAQALLALHDAYDIEIKSHFQACDELGGDMWNVWPIDTHRIGFSVIDFTGHGVVASLNTFRFQSLTSTMVFDPQDQVRYAEKLNRKLHRMLPSGQFATAIGGYIDLARDVMRYTVAAGPKPFIVSPDYPDGAFLKSAGRPLGMTADSTYEEYEEAFPPGSSLFLYSDALTETPDMINPVYDEDRMQAALTGRIDAQRHPFDVVLTDFLDHTMTEPLNDDLTMIMLSRPGKS
jgi:sigma-B regulation protein RsbU (phosphoserine phosphatase)